MAKAPLITLCICSYNRYDLLPQAIESVVRQSLPEDLFRILVVDNSPAVGRSDEFAARYGSSRLDYIVEPTPGLSNARNVAARKSQAPIIAFLDDDAVAAPDWAEEVLKAFDSLGPDVKVVGGRVDPIWSERKPAWLHESLLGNLSIIDWGGETRIAGEKEWLAGTNIAFRVSTILEKGGFSTGLGRRGAGFSLLSNEETQLLERIRADGGQVGYAPGARVDHLVEAERLRREWFRKRAAWQAVSDFMMQPDKTIVDARNRWPSIIEFLNMAPPRERTVRGLHYEVEDAARFSGQVGAAYQMTSLLLAGFEGIDGD